MSADKRREPRVDTNQSIWVEGQEVRVVAEARNMSKTGMFVVAPNSGVEIGSTLEIKFDDPLEGQIAVTMEVVWRDEKTTTSSLGLRTIESQGTAAFERVVSRYLGAEQAKDEPPAPEPRTKSEPRPRTEPPAKST